MASLMRRLPWLGLLALAALLVAAAVSAGESDGLLSEHEVKAAFVLNFVRFVNWPSGTPDAELGICTQGDGPLAQAVDKLTRGKQVGGRQLRVYVTPLGAGPECSVLLVDGNHGKKAYTLLASVDKKPVLTIGEGPSFLANGGMLTLLVENRRVVFEANPAAIQRAGLDISSSLLRLARNLRWGGLP